jgi:uncharacterized membrane protein
VSDIFDKVGLDVMARWLHIVAGITWIGLLYYFNLVQVPSFANFGAPARLEAIEKLASRALWWFRWAAVGTLVTGLLIIAILGDDYPTDGGPWASILTGMLLAVVMFGNVWLVIWPNQKLIIANAVNVQAGGAANPDLAAITRKAALASRQNVFFSVPMIWFMTFTTHFAPYADDVEGGKLVVYWILTLAIVAVLELNALGIIGGTGPGPLKWPYETVRNVLISAWALWAVFLVIWIILF